ncbi:MAG TPA: hypothetical protein VGI86_03535 [Acidimicrobiia bacterium]|jgi:hypothetical protein
MKVGTRVEVRNRFDARWSRGFEIVDIQSDPPPPHYLLRRRSDGNLLPAEFNENDLREERRRQTWWV